MQRTHLATLAQETVAIIARGDYVVEGVKYTIRTSIANTNANTITYSPQDPLPAKTGTYDTAITALNTTTLEAARNLVNPVALNFASARNPGGGFLRGSRAQEESLARASGLYASIKNSPMYAFHRRYRSPMYAGFIIYSPKVTVIRNDQGALVKPWPCSFISAPAVNAGVARQRNQRNVVPEEDITQTMRTRIHRVLGTAVKYGHTNVVLGAWGCGVFRNDPRTIAGLFYAALRGPFKGVFENVVFAVLDTRNRGPPAPCWHGT